MIPYPISAASAPSSIAQAASSVFVPSGSHHSLAAAPAPSPPPLHTFHLLIAALVLASFGASHGTELIETLKRASHLEFYGFAIALYIVGEALRDAANRLAGNLQVSRLRRHGRDGSQRAPPLASEISFSGIRDVLS